MIMELRQLSRDTGLAVGYIQSMRLAVSLDDTSNSRSLDTIDLLVATIESISATMDETLSTRDQSRVG